jgi:S1-C subfamily serine protease
LLKVAGKFIPIPISKEDAALGDAVFTIGFPNVDLQGTQPKYTDGKISSLAGIKDDLRQYQISVPVQPGNSGGPLVDSAGSVKGVIVARLNDIAVLETSGTIPQNVNYAVKAKYLRDFISTSPQVKLPDTGIASENKNAVKDAQRSAAMILIY